MLRAPSYVKRRADPRVASHCKLIIDLLCRGQSEPVRRDTRQAPLVSNELNSVGPTELVLARRDLIDQMSTPRL